MTRPGVCVTVATYRRNEILTDTLRSLVAMDHPEPFSIVVADNDPDGGAAEVVGEWSTASVPVSYVHEPRPGIAAARNAALAVSGDVARVAILDDDEVAAPDWLSRLEAALDEDPGVCAVQGAVEYLFDVPPPSWVATGGFFISVPEHRTTLPFAATNNLIIDRTRLPHGFDLRFDDAFGLTGGSDIALTRALTRAGGRIVTAPDAVVSERVPASRCGPRWALARAARTGNTLARVERTVDGRRRPVVAATALARVLTAVPGLLVGVLRGDDRRRGEAVRRAARGFGGLAACLRIDVVEYARGTNP